MAPLSRAVPKKFSNMEGRVKLLDKRLEEQANNMLLLIQMVKEMEDGSSSSENQRNIHNSEVSSTRSQGMIPNYNFLLLILPILAFGLRSAVGTLLCLKLPMIVE